MHLYEPFSGVLLDALNRTSLNRRPLLADIGPAGLASSSQAPVANEAHHSPEERPAGIEDWGGHED